MSKLDLITLMLIFFVFGTFSWTKGQNQRIISLNLNKVSLDQALHIFEEKSGIRLSYNNIMVKPYSFEHFEAINENYEDVLTKLLMSTELVYKKSGIDGVILIYPKNSIPLIKVSGKVIDSKTGQTLPGVTLRIKGNSLATSTGGDGTFDLKVNSEVPITLIISYIGYKTQEIKISSSKQITIGLEQGSKVLNEVVVQVRKRVDNELVLLNERKTAAIVSDGISAKQMEKTASITTVQALQRISGVTITDDKFVAIRGLGERAVIAELNGARLSSANPDRSAVPLDLVPAALLDNITVYKTLTPDRPADASAGIIELKTKSIPDSLSVSFTAELGANSSIGIGGKYNSFINSEPGFFGQNIKNHDLSSAFTNLATQYPGGNVQIQRLIIESRLSPALTAEANRINNINLTFDPVLTTKYQKSNPNQIYTVSYGNTFFKGHLGIIVSGNYYQRFEDQYHGKLNQYSIYAGVVTGSPKVFSPLYIPNYSTPDDIQLGKFLTYQENRGKQTINYGLLTGISYRINSLNEISIQYIGSRGAEVEGSNLIGSWQNTNLNYPVYNTIYGLHQTYRIFNTYNFQGEHKLFHSKWSPQISWNASISKSNQDEPDYRTADLADAHTTKVGDISGLGIGSDTYVLVVGQVSGINTTPIVADPNGRSFRNLNENNYNIKGDFTEPIQLGKLREVFKFGFNYLKRDRVYTETLVGLPGSRLGGDDGLLQAVNGNLNALVSFKNIGLGNPANYDTEGQAKTGVFLYQSQKSPNNYTGSYLTKAAYGLLDAHIIPSLRIIGGVRFESTDIKAKVDTSQVFNPNAAQTYILSPYDTIKTISPNSAYHTDYKPYYSINLIYTLRKNMNFRLAYSTSLARPELREITNIYEFDPFQFAVIVGNPNLVNQLTRSADFRWEWFPSPGEVISASAFGKKIYSQLTKTFTLNSKGTATNFPEFPSIQFINDTRVGEVYGVEFEIRKDLGRTIHPLKNFYFGTNLLLASSIVQKNAARILASRTIDPNASSSSPVFEQAPYSLNTYLDYDNRKWGTNATLSFNMVGERLIQVQVDGTPDLYSRPVPLLDFVFSQTLGKRFLIKGFAKNILNPPYRNVYALPGQNGLYRGQSYINHEYFRGVEYALGLTYILF